MFVLYIKVFLSITYHISGNIDSDINWDDLVDHFSVAKLKFAIIYNFPLVL